MMKRMFKVEKLSIEALLSLLMDLYEKGMDFVDLTSDHSDPEHDKLIIMTRDEYINPEAKKQMDENGENIEDVFPEHKPENKKKFREDHKFPPPKDEDDDDDEDDDEDDYGYGREEDEQPPKNKFEIKGKKLTDEDLDNLI